MIVVIALAAVLLGVVIFLRTALNPDTLGREAVRRINASGVLTLEAETFRLDIFHGLTVENARAVSADGTTTVTVGRMRLEHELWPLFGGRLVLRRLLLEKPRIEVVSGRAVAAATAHAGGDNAREVPASEPLRADEKSGLRFEIAELRIEDGALASRTAGHEPDFRLEGLHVVLDGLRFEPTAGAGIAGLTAGGRFDAKRLLSGTIIGREAAGTLRLEAGDLVLEATEMTTDLGRMVLEELAVSLDSDPFPYRLTLASDLDLNAILGSTDESFGDLHLELAAEGAGPETDHLHGTGRLRFSAGTIASSPLVQAIEDTIGPLALAGHDYDAAEVRFRIAHDRIAVDPFDLVAEQLALGSGGSIGLDGSLDMALHVRVPRALIRIREIPDGVLDALTGDNGLTSLPLRVVGSLERPKVTLDRKALGEAAQQGAKKAVNKEVDKLLNKLLGAKRNGG